MNNSYDERPYRLNKDTSLEHESGDIKPIKHKRLPFIIEIIICVAVILTALGIKYFDKESFIALQQGYTEVMSNELSFFGLDKAVFNKQSNEQIKDSTINEKVKLDNSNSEQGENTSSQTENDSDALDIDNADTDDSKIYASTAELLGYTPFNMPVEDAVLTSDFGVRLTDESVSFHKGLDLAVPFGTPISPAMNGTVIAVGESESYGNYIKVLHTEDVSTFYAHCSSIQSSEGDAVTTEDVIAFVGSSGDSTGPHVHFEVRFDDHAMDPNGFFTEEVMQTVKSVAIAE